MGWADIFIAIGYYAVYPVVFIVPSLLELLKVLVAPLTHVVVLLLRIALVPIRVLRNLESLYIFFGVATLVGVSAGCVLHFTLRFIYELLGLEEPPSSGRDVKSRARLRPPRGKLVRHEHEHDEDEDF